MVPCPGLFHPISGVGGAGLSIVMTVAGFGARSRRNWVRSCCVVVLRAETGWVETHFECASGSDCWVDLFASFWGWSCVVAGGLWDCAAAVKNFVIRGC